MVCLQLINYCYARRNSCGIYVYGIPQKNQRKLSKGVHKCLSMKVKGSSTGVLLINESPKPNGRREKNIYEEVKEKILPRGGGENIMKRVKACWLKCLQLVEVT